MKRSAEDAESTDTASSTSSQPRKKLKSLKDPRPPPAHILADVVSGAALPMTAAEAKQAANARLAQLRGQHRPTAKVWTDLIPELFEQKNFASAGEVRCVCGAIVDDGAAMISCDSCKVWQHQKCIGEALPKNLDRGSYGCHVCDPWRHRETVARLRRGEEV